MLDPETRRSALLQLGFAAQKVHEATDLATDLGLPPPSYSDYVRLTGLQRRNVAIGLAECVRLGFLERIEINPRHVEYRIPAGRQIVASHRLQQEDQLESLRRYLLSASLDQLE